LDLLEERGTRSPRATQRHIFAHKVFDEMILWASFSVFWFWCSKRSMCVCAFFLFVLWELVSWLRENGREMMV